MSQNRNLNGVFLRICATHAGCVGLFLTLTLAVVLAPYFLFGHASVFLVHDHLDSTVAWATVLANESKFFAEPSDVVNGILGGVERRFFAAPSKIYYWFYEVFPPFQAIIAAEVLTRVVAFLGLYALLVDFVIKDHASDKAATIMAALVSMWFALLPYWLPSGAGVSGIPLFFWAALTVRRGQVSRRKLACALAATGLYSVYGFLITSGFFALCFTTTFILRDALVGNWLCAGRLFVFNSLTSVAFLAQNFSLLRAVSSDEKTSRDELVFSTVPLDSFPEIFAENLLNGQYHASPGVEWPVFLAVCVAIGLICMPQLRSKNSPVKLAGFAGIFWITAGYLIFTALAFAAFQLEPVQVFTDRLDLSAFNFGRFHWLQPGLWAVLFFCALMILVVTATPGASPSRAGDETQTSASRRRGFAGKAFRALPFLLVAMQILMTASDLSAYQSKTAKRHASFETFFDFELFAALKEQLDQESGTARIGAVGFHPAVAQVNKIATVGGYLAIYPLDTKHAFREIIAGELDKSDRLRSYFDEWGSRAYFLSHDLSDCRFMCWENAAPPKINLDLNMAAFKGFGGTHLVSVSEIENAAALNLEFVDVFVNDRFDDDRWRLYLYRAAAR